MRRRIVEIFDESNRIRELFIVSELDKLISIIDELASVIGNNNKILFMGNGGSAADAQHLAGEFVNRFLRDRPPLPAMALTVDSSVLTAIANDFGYEFIFEKQVRALGSPGDAIVGISTSGNSVNVNRGLEAAAAKGMITIGLGGPSHSQMEQYCKHYLPIEGGITPRIQELHILIGHIIVEQIDELLFGTK